MIYGIPWETAQVYVKRGAYGFGSSNVAVAVQNTVLPAICSVTLAPPAMLRHHRVRCDVKQRIVSPFRMYLAGVV